MTHAIFHGRLRGLPQVKDVDVISQIIVPQSAGVSPAAHGQVLSNRGDASESVNDVFAKIVSGHAQPGDFARYVDLWDKLQAAQWSRRPKQP